MMKDYPKGQTRSEATSGEVDKTGVFPFLSILWVRSPPANERRISGDFSSKIAHNLSPMRLSGEFWKVGYTSQSLLTQGVLQRQ